MSMTELGPHEREFERTPPHDVAAEQSVIGGMLISPTAIAEVIEVIRATDFYRPAHQILYDTILDLYGRGEPADAVTIVAELTKRGDITRVGGAPYLHTLMATVPTAANAGYYAKIVRERAVLRKLVEVGTRIVQLGYASDGADADDVLDRAQAEVFAIAEKRTGEDYVQLSEIMPGALDEIEAIGSRGGQMVGVPTGFSDLDALTNGLHPGQMIIIAARPAIGKALWVQTRMPTPTGWTTMGDVAVGDYLLGANGRPTRVVAATDVMTDRPCYEVEFSDGEVVVADAQHLWRTTARVSGGHRLGAAAWADAGQRSGGLPTTPTGGTSLAEPFVVDGQHRVLADRRAAGGARDLLGLSAGAGKTFSFGLVLHTLAGRRVIRSGATRRDGELSELGRFGVGLKSIWPSENWTRADSRQSIWTTEEIFRTLRVDGGRPNHSVEAAAAFDLPPDTDLLVHPYLLGVWLGGRNGSTDVIMCHDEEVVAEIAATGQPIIRSVAPGGHELPGLAKKLRELGVLGDKHIPQSYLRASKEQRRSLLAGLLDTDGLGSRTGQVQVGFVNRRLAAGVRELVLSLGYCVTMRTKDVEGKTPEPVYMVSFTPTETVFRLPRKAARQRKAVHPKARVRYIVDVRPVPSVPVRCVQVDNADQMYLAGRSCIPTHNSTLALDFARAASIKHGLSAAFFSLEMGRNEITMRLLSAEARVALHAMRSGTMQDEDWTRLARRMSEVAEAPLFIDDSPNMSMMEIRAKCRRLKQQHDLRLVIIDYLQLMSSGKRVESRQVEVSEFSRSLKLLAKELGVPVIALSQLNRGPEQRTDKKPMVSDLRESGCLSADTGLLRADSGAEITLGELMESGARDVPVWSLDDRLKLVPRTLTHAFPSGVKETFRVRLSSGREVKATANHPFLTYDGWMPLGELTPGSRVAALRHIPAPLQIQRMPADEIILLAHMIGDGSLVKRQPIRYASTDEACLTAVAEAAKRFGVTAVRDEYEAARVITLRLPAPYRLTHGKRNPIAKWADALGLFGLRSHEKFVPSPIFQLPKEQVALFLRHLWSTDGCVSWDDKQGQCRLYYASTSRRLIDDVARLLLRFGIMSRVKIVQKAGYRPGFQLHLYGAGNQLTFFDVVGVFGGRGVAAARSATHLRQMRSNTNVDTVPRAVWDDVRELLTERQMTHREFAAAIGTKFSGSALWKRAPSRERLGAVATVLDCAELELMATNDVLWDEIVSVESLGDMPVYDATVMGAHNFVANGINVKNSIEQDADMVILLHREDAYEKESPRAGEADLIVAKHRNGPTATVTVAFQGHYSRFVDMAQ